MPSASPLDIEIFELGPFQTNCYVLAPSARTDTANADCWIVDASFDAERIVEFLRREGLTPTALMLTHAHVDHMAGIPALRRAYPGLPIVMHAAEGDWLNNATLNLSAFSGLKITAGGARADRWLQDGDRVPFNLGTAKDAAIDFHVLHTPGHSPGGLTFHAPSAGVAFVGDTLFAGSIGRSDFPGSDFETLAQSIRSKLYRLPPDTVIYPGHGPESTIAREMASNPFVRPHASGQ